MPVAEADIAEACEWWHDNRSLEQAHRWYLEIYPASRPICSYSSAVSGSSDGAAGGLPHPSRKTSSAPSSNCFFQRLIWVGCKLCFRAISAIVLTSLSASRGTLALKAGVNERRFRATALSSVMGFQLQVHFHRSKRDFLSCPVVLKSGSTSNYLSPVPIRPGLTQLQTWNHFLKKTHYQFFPAFRK